MALAPTLYDVQLELVDSDRGVECKRTLKVARHPSETMDRMWLRLLAYCWRYDERLTFTVGLADPEQPDLRSDDLTGRTTQWIRVGKAEPAKIRRAVTQNPGAEISVFFDSVRGLETFVGEAVTGKVTHLEEARLATIDSAVLRTLAGHDARRIKLGLTLSGEHLYFDVDGEAMDAPLIFGRVSASR